MKELLLSYPTLEALRSDYAQNLRKGRAFIALATVSAAGERERCRVEIVHPATGAKLGLDAEVVWVKADAPGAGVGIELLLADDPAREALRRFVEESPEKEEVDDAAPGTRTVHERVRGLSARERDSMAKQGSLPERVALERCYGSAVWETLLQNPHVTPPEVARIAKMGSLPRPLAQIIVNNAAWLAIPEVQRALLANPRVGGGDLDRVLRAMPRASLELAASLTLYRVEVRQAAKRLLGRAG